MLHKYIYAMLASILFFLASCSKDANTVNENEVITDFIVDLKSADGSDIVKLSFSDTDGDGGKAPIITSGILKKNTIYTASLSLKGKHGSHSDDITAEILEEAKSHQFFFSTDITGVSFQYKDKDDNNHPIGLESSWSTASPASGKIKIILKHEPVKTGAGVSAGDITNAGGETDIEVEFSVTVI